MPGKIPVFQDDRAIALSNGSPQSKQLSDGGRRERAGSCPTKVRASAPVRAAGDADLTRQAEGPSPAAFVWSSVVGLGRQQFSGHRVHSCLKCLAAIRGLDL